MKPRVFISSSKTNLHIATTMQELLEGNRDIEARVWTQNVFDLSSFPLESLVNRLDEYDFGIFVFAPDDIVMMDNVEYKAVRDNVVFELGLFVGRLGIRRSFLVMPRDRSNVHLPTDLLGLTCAPYDDSRIDEEPHAALGATYNQIRMAIKRLGVMERGNEHNPVKYSSTIILRHVATQRTLHSQDKTFTHPGTSGQQQITCRDRTDTNCYWIIKGRHGQAQSEVAGQDIHCGSIIRLEHLNTRTNLHSHSGFPSAVTSQQEVTGFGSNGNGDDNDDWEVVEISAGMAVWATGNAIKLRHRKTGCLLHSQADMSHYEYTHGQQEVTCNEDRNNNEWWEAIIVRR